MVLTTESGVGNYLLAGEAVERKEISCMGIENSNTTKRISAARKRVEELRSIGLIGFLHPIRGRALYISIDMNIDSSHTGVSILD